MSATLAQRIIVTGGRGRLASLVAEHFQTPDRQLELFSRRAGGGFHPLGELTSPARLSGAKAILHFAWSTLPASSELGAGAEFRDDLPFLENMLGAIAALPVDRRPLLVFFSSGGTVYGNATDRPNTEDDACAPIGCYGRAKVAAEQLIRAQAQQHGLRCAILRVSNPYGFPVPKDRVQGIIPHAIRCATTGQPLALWGDGSARKDFLHSTDFLSALELVVQRGLTGTFNICAGESHSVDEIFSLVEKFTGRRVPFALAPRPAWDVRDSRLSHAKFSAATGWQPKVNLTDGIRLAVANFPVF